MVCLKEMTMNILCLKCTLPRMTAFFFLDYPSLRSPQVFVVLAPDWCKPNWSNQSLHQLTCLQLFFQKAKIKAKFNFQLKNKCLNFEDKILRQKCISHKILKNFVTNMFGGPWPEKCCLLLLQMCSVCGCYTLIEKCLRATDGAWLAWYVNTCYISGSFIWFCSIDTSYLEIACCLQKRTIRTLQN